MYTLTNLSIYSESNNQHFEKIKNLLIERNIIFKELHSLKLIFSEIKNPQNHIILLINNPECLSQFESICKNCFNFQNRIFAIFNTPDLNDNFFHQSSDINTLEPLENFITNISSKNIYAQKPQTLLYKLIKSELKKLNLTEKYIGFEYLAEGLTNALGFNYYSHNHIDMFESVIATHCTTLDTIERDVRHMLQTAWENNEIFKHSLNIKHLSTKPNLKSLLNAIIEHIKKTI